MAQTGREVCLRLGKNPVSGNFNSTYYNERSGFLLADAASAAPPKVFLEDLTERRLVVWIKNKESTLLNCLLRPAQIRLVHVIRTGTDRGTAAACCVCLFEKKESHKNT